MQAIGTIRKFDKLGRIVIPKEYRRLLKMNCNEPVEILLTNTGVLIKKPSTFCQLCGKDSELAEFQDGHLCKSCISEIKKL